MRITDVQATAVRVNHRGDWLHVHLITDDGITGIGEASHGGFSPQRDAVVAHFIATVCKPILIGADPTQVRAIMASLAPLMDGLAACTAVSACEQALWDLAGKATGLPVHRLLGGAVRERIPLYANINRAVLQRTPDAFAQAAAAAVAEGFHAVKCAPFDGMEQRRVREREQRDRTTHGLACVAAIREAIGPDRDLYVDCQSKFDVPIAVEVARALRDLGVTWFEEPVPTEDRAALARLRPLVGDMELIGGELLNGIAGFWPYLEAGIWDCIMPDVKHCGGIAALLAIGETALARGVTVAPHNPSGPVALAASAQVAVVFPHLRGLEYAWGEVPWRAEVVSPAEQIEDGMYVLPTGPGLGVILNAHTTARTM